MGRGGVTSSTPFFEWLCCRIVQQGDDAIIFADPDGIIRLWNKGAERIFAFKAEEALGKSLDLIIPERWRGRHWQGFRQVMATGRTKYRQGELLTVPGQDREGRQVSLEFSLTLIKRDDGQILGVAAILRDVTARWNEVKALRRRLAELEEKVKPSPGGQSGAAIGTNLPAAV